VFSVLSADNKHILGKSAFAWDMVLHQWVIAALCLETAWSSWKVRHPVMWCPYLEEQGFQLQHCKKT